MKRMIFAAAIFAATALTGVALPSAAGAQPRGSYLQSCRAVRERGGVLSAECRDMRGRWRQTTLRHRDCRGDIGNNNGQLVCARGSGGPGWGGPGWGGGRMPGGSWARSCVSPNMRGSVLSARCDNGRGRRVDARLDMRSCRSGNAGNRSGRLVCE